MSIRATDTIVAPATAPIKSGVAIIRISGPDAFAVAPHLGFTLPQARLATLISLKDEKNGLIDHALVLAFPGPASFTGEDSLELHIHGSRAIIATLMESLTSLPGFRVAEPGEFARRAFLNGKMDLTQAEGLADLIDAETSAQAKQALRQMRGETGRTYTAMRERILMALALLEAYIDFPDEEIPSSVLADMMAKIGELQTSITRLLDDGHRGERLREGIEIVILGPPNAGKSSLLNALAKRDAAIVSPIAGTTRDMVEIHLDLGGYPVTLIDTAGLHEATDSIESEGIRRARERAANAELTLILFDITTDPSAHPDILSMEDGNSLRVYTKSDTSPAGAKTDGLTLSTVTGDGMDRLLSELATRIGTRYQGVGASLITRSRHRQSLTECLVHLNGVKADNPLEINGEELRMAARALARITGEMTVDDILDRVFSTFCIGK